MRKWLVGMMALTLAGVAHAQKVTPKEVLANMEATWAKTDSYTCREDAWTKAGSVEKTQAFDFSFKKPRLIRLKVQADPHKGADVTYRDGKIRAAERILGIRMKKGMDPKDGDFYSARKVPFWDVDMGSEIAGIKAALPGADASALRAKSGTDTVIYLTLKWKGEDSRLKQGAHSYVVTYKLDAKSWFPLERVTTEDGAKVEDIKRTSVNLHASLADGAFNL
jgi:outer membrane lipoprotein-sorting protein